MTFLSAEDRVRYELLGEIGRGSFATVYKAVDKSCHRTVAIKVLRSIPTENVFERFMREVRVCLDLRHPNIISMYDANFDVEIPYLVMEYIEAEDISERISRGDLTIKESLSIAKQIGEALQCLHERELLHRDIKPANILLDKDGRAVLTDFNLVYVENATVLTKTGQIVGTPNYIPPEQWYGAPPDVQGDIYALGKVLYEMLTCSNIESLEKRLSVDPTSPYPPLQEINPKISEAIGDVVAKAIIFPADFRYRCAEELLEALADLEELERPPLPIDIDKGVRKTRHGKSLGNKWLYVIIVLFFMSTCAFITIWKHKAPTSSLPIFKSIEPSIIGVSVSFEDCRHDFYDLTLRTADGKKRWQKKKTKSENGKLHFIVPWKDYSPGATILAKDSSGVAGRTTCPSLDRFRLDPPETEYNRRMILIDWPCTHDFKGQVSFSRADGAKNKKEANFRNGHFRFGLPLESLLMSPIEARLLLEDNVGGTMKSPKVLIPKLDIEDFLKRAKTYRIQENSFEKLRERVISSVMSLEELSTVKRLVEGRPKDEVIKSISTEAKAFRKYVTNIVDAEQFLFSSWAIERDKKQSLFNEFTHLQEMDRALMVIGASPIFRSWGLRRPGAFVNIRRARGRFHPQYEDADVIHIHEGEMPLIAALSGQLQGFREEMISVAIEREKSEEVTLRFDVRRDWLRNCGRRVGIYIRATLEKDTHLRMTLNESLNLVLWSEVTKMTKKRWVINNEVHFPRWLLRSGENSLRIRHVSVLPRLERLALLIRVKLLPQVFLRGRRKRDE